MPASVDGRSTSNRNIWESGLRLLRANVTLFFQKGRWPYRRLAAPTSHANSFLLAPLPQVSLQDLQQVIHRSERSGNPHRLRSLQQARVRLSFVRQALQRRESAEETHSLGPLQSQRLSMSLMRQRIWPASPSPETFRQRPFGKGST